MNKTLISMHLLRNFPPVVASLVVALSPFAVGQTATTDPVGFSTVQISVGTSLVVPTLNDNSVFVGMAAISSDGLSITPLISPQWTAGSYSKTAFALPTPNYPTHYAEIISGPQEGLTIDIDANTTTALMAFAGDISPASGLRGTTVQVAVRRHVTLDTLIEGASGLSAYQDSFSVYNSDGTQSICNYDGESFVDRNFANRVGHTVIYPGTGIVCSVNAPVQMIFSGGVKTTKTQIPLYAGATNIVGPLNPSSATLLYGNQSLAQALAPYQDGINNYSTNGQMTAVPYSSDGTAILDRNFSSLPPTSTDAIGLNRGVVITVVADTVWTAPSPLPASNP